MYICIIYICIHIWGMQLLDPSPGFFICQIVSLHVYDWEMCMILRYHNLLQIMVLFLIIAIGQPQPAPHYLIKLQISTTILEIAPLCQPCLSLDSSIPYENLPSLLKSLYKGYGQCGSAQTCEKREREIILLSSEVKYDLWDQKYYISHDKCESE